MGRARVSIEIKSGGKTLRSTVVTDRPAETIERAMRLQDRLVRRNGSADLRGKVQEI